MNAHAATPSSAHAIFVVFTPRLKRWFAPRPSPWQARCPSAPAQAPGGDRQARRCRRHRLRRRRRHPGAGRCRPVRLCRHRPRRRLGARRRPDRARAPGQRERGAEDLHRHARARSARCSASPSTMPPNPNIYLAATSAYGLSIGVADASGQMKRVQRGEAGAQFVPGQFGPPELGGGPGSIWRVDGTTGEVSLFATVGNGGDRRRVARRARLRPGDPADLRRRPVHRHRLSLRPRRRRSRGTYDHGVEGRPGCRPAADPARRWRRSTSPARRSTPPTPRPGDSRRRRAASSRSPCTTTGCSIRSLRGRRSGPSQINPDGTVSGGARIEVEVPSLQDGIEITSIAFDGQGRMYLAERGATTGDYSMYALANGGQSRVLRYLSRTGPATGSPRPSSIRSAWRRTTTTPTAALRSATATRRRATAPSSTSAPATRPSGRPASACSIPAIPTPRRGPSPTSTACRATTTSLVQPQNTPPTASWFIDYDDKAGYPDFRGYMGAIATLPCAGQAGAAARRRDLPAGHLFRRQPVHHHPDLPARHELSERAVRLSDLSSGLLRAERPVRAAAGELPAGHLLLPGPVLPDQLPAGHDQAAERAVHLRAGRRLLQRPVRAAAVVPAAPGQAAQRHLLVPARPDLRQRRLPAAAEVRPGKVLRNGQCVPQGCPPNKDLFNGQCVPKCPLGIHPQDAQWRLQAADHCACRQRRCGTASAWRSARPASGSHAAERRLQAEDQSSRRSRCACRRRRCGTASAWPSARPAHVPHAARTAPASPIVAPVPAAEGNVERQVRGEVPAGSGPHRRRTAPASRRSSCRRSSCACRRRRCGTVSAWRSARPARFTPAERRLQADASSSRRSSCACRRRKSGTASAWPSARRAGAHPPNGACKPMIIQPPVKLCLPPKEMWQRPVRAAVPARPGPHPPNGACKPMIIQPPVKLCLQPKEMWNGQCVPQCPPGQVHTGRTAPAS